MTSLPKYLTVAQAADALGISVQRVGQLVQQGKLKTVKRQLGYRRSVNHITRAQVLKRLALAEKNA